MVVLLSLLLLLKRSLLGEVVGVDLLMRSGCT